MECPTLFTPAALQISLPFYSEQRSPSYKSYTSTWPVGLKRFFLRTCVMKKPCTLLRSWPGFISHVSFVPFLFVAPALSRAFFSRFDPGTFLKNQRRLTPKTWYLQRMTAVSYNFLIVSWVDDIWLLSWSQYVHIEKTARTKNCIHHFSERFRPTCQELQIAAPLRRSYFVDTSFQHTLHTARLQHRSVRGRNPHQAVSS